MPYMCNMGYRVCREYSTAVDLSLLVVECDMELALDIIGERFTTLYQMSKPTYLSRNVFPSGDRYIDIYINHGGQVARLPVSYTSSLSFCHSSHVVVYFILLSVVSKFCSGLRGIFSSHTGQHEKLVPVSTVQSILYTYCQIILCEPSLSTILSYKQNVYQQ